MQDQGSTPDGELGPIANQQDEDIGWATYLQPLADFNARHGNDSDLQHDEVPAPEGLNIGSTETISESSSGIDLEFDAVLAINALEDPFIETFNENDSGQDLELSEDLADQAQQVLAIGTLSDNDHQDISRILLEVSCSVYTGPSAEPFPTPAPSINAGELIYPSPARMHTPGPGMFAGVPTQISPTRMCTPAPSILSGERMYTSPLQMHTPRPDDYSNAQRHDQILGDAAGGPTLEQELGREAILRKESCPSSPIWVQHEKDIPRCFYEDAIDQDQSYDWSDVFFLTHGRFELGPYAVRNRRQQGPHHTMIHQVLNAKAVNAGVPDLAREFLSLRIKDLLRRANEDEIRLSIARENETWAQKYANVWYNVYREESNTPIKREALFKTMNKPIALVLPDRLLSIGSRKIDRKYCHEQYRNHWGRNVLGKVLMYLRAELAAQYPEEAARGRDLALREEQEALQKRNRAS